MILPHKSWHIWNQDNREKVLRDERLHREQLETKVAKERDQIRQHNFDLLTREPESDAKQHSSNKEAIPKSSKSKSSSYNNEEFEREAKEHEERRKRREGVADWGFGQGPFENKDTKLWYTQVPKSVAGGADNDHDKSRSAQDPMEKYLHNFAYNECKEEEKTSYTSLLKTGKQTRPGSTVGSEHRHKEKKRKKFEEAHHSNYSVDDKLEKLRQKRLAREKTEGKKAAILLAKADIYGNGVESSSRYNQQYNPTFARNK